MAFCYESADLSFIISVAHFVQEPPALRMIIAFSAGTTLLYTPVLKRMTGVKNLAVAAVIALSPLSGALAAGLVSSAPGLEK